MKATDKDQFDSRDNGSNKQAMTGSEGGQGFPQSGAEGDSIGSSLGEGNSKKLPSKDEDGRRQDERDHKEYGNTGYPEQEKGKNIPHGSNDASNEARTKANDDKSDTYKNR